MGDTAEQQLRGFADLFVGEDQVGDLRTTLRTDLQTVAREQLGQRRGAVVAIDPQTGEILAFWDYPSYDPNALSTHDLEEARAAREFLQPDSPDSPLIATSYQDRFFPGSTFKVVVGSSGLKFGVVTPEEPVYPTEASWVPPQTTRPLNNSHTCGGALFEILAESCNTSFARMAVETLGADRTIEGAEAFGFNDTPPIDLPDPVESNFPTDFTDNTPALAQSAIGQFEVAASPLQMALVAAGIANDGVIMAPHTVDELRDGDGDVIETFDERGLAAADQRRRRRHHAGRHAGRGRRWHRQQPGRAALRRRGQDRYGPARHRPAVLARLDDRLGRSRRRRARDRRGGPRRGHPRPGQRGHRQRPGRADRRGHDRDLPGRGLSDSPGGVASAVAPRHYPVAP